MRTIHRSLRRSAFALALSITALPTIVNAQPRSSTKDTKTGVAKLINTLLKSGVDSSISSVLAPVIGLPKAMPMRKQEIMTLEKGKDFEKRACFVIYENEESPITEAAEKRAICAYIIKSKRSGLDSQTHYFRIDLNGKLEKAILSQGKWDETGKVVRGSGVKFDQDINSPEVRKTFEAEMKFWLKDWLKKERKNAATTAL